MLNEIINEVEVGSSGSYSSESQGLLTLAGLNISEFFIKATNIQDNIEVSLNSYDIPQGHGRGFLSSFKRGRNIDMTVYIKGNNQIEFQEKLDAFRLACFTKNATFDDARSGEVRRLVVNCTSSPMIFNHYNIDFIRLQVSFVSLEPFWYNIDYQSTSIFSATENFSEEITTIGTGESKIITYITFNSTTSTEVIMSLGEDSMQINHSFSAGDILRIDGEKFVVELLGVEIEYGSTSVFPIFEAGKNSLDFQINGEFDCDVVILNKKNYV